MASSPVILDKILAVIAANIQSINKVDMTRGILQLFPNV
jgi:hypothetical protein